MILTPMTLGIGALVSTKISKELMNRPETYGKTQFR
jgi:hypothetical protein